MKHISRLMGQLCPISNPYKTKLSAMLAVMTLFMCLIAAYKAPAQTGAAVNTEGVEWTTAAVSEPELSIHELNVGDAVPDEWWDMPLTLWTAANDVTETITLGDYRGKAIILDFWATWCGNCLYGMPDLFNLQEKYGDDILALPVTYEEADYVSGFVYASSYERLVQVRPVFRTVTNNRAFFEHFPFNKSLPLIVVISQEGLVDAITSSRMLTDEYVGALVSGAERYAPLKRSRIEQMPPLLEFSLEDVRQYKPVFYTSLSGEIDGAESLRQTVRDSVNGTARTVLSNHTILELYAAGRYGETQRDFAFTGPGRENRVILEVKDPDKYLHHYDENIGMRTVFDLAWRRANRYTYESVMPLREADELKTRIIGDLNRFLGLDGRIENRKVTVMVLTINEQFNRDRTLTNGPMLIINNGWKTGRSIQDTLVGPNPDGYTTYIENMQLKSIPSQISFTFDKLLDNPNFPTPVIIDETGLDPGLLISLGFTDKPSPSFEELIENLRKQGLELKTTEREIPMFVLTEPGYEAQPGERLILTRYGNVPESHIDRINRKP